MNTQKPKSPRITQLAWGEMTIDGVGSGKDFKLWPGGGRPWDWSETRTSHSPGIQSADVAELIDHGCSAVVLSQGMQRRLGVAPETLDLLKSKGIEVHIAETKASVKIYNELAERSIAVGGLFHSTC